MIREPELKSDLLDAVLWGQAHDVFRDRIGQALLRNYKLGVVDSEITEMILGRVRHAQVGRALGQAPPFRRPRLSDRGIVLGFDTDHEPVAVPIDGFNSGMLLAGNTGSTKSNYLNALAIQIAVAGCTIWIAEMYKAQTRHIRPVLARVGINLIILAASQWKYNYLQVGRGIDPRTYRAWSSA